LIFRFYKGAVPLRFHTPDLACLALRLGWAWSDVGLGAGRLGPKNFRRG
jgi:hypothetical protein